MKPAQWQVWLRQQTSKPPFVEYVGDEQVDIPASYRQMMAAARTKPLKSMPLVAISHGIPDSTDEQGIKGLARASEQMWQAMQTGLANLLPDGRRVVAHKSHHQIPKEQPRIIISTLARLITQAS